MLGTAARIGGGAVNLTVLLVFLAFIAWFTLPRILGWQPQVVLSGSMEPTLPVGSVAFVEPKTAGQVRVGDVLTFRHPDNPQTRVTHRITEIVRDGGGLAFKTKGDASQVEDPWLVPAANMVGTVRWDVPYLGYVKNHVQTPWGFLLLVGAPAAYIVLGEVHNIVRQLRRPRAGSEEAP